MSNGNEQILESAAETVRTVYVKLKMTAPREIRFDEGDEERIVVTVRRERKGHTGKLPPMEFVVPEPMEVVGV